MRGVDKWPCHQIASLEPNKHRGSIPPSRSSYMQAVDEWTRHQASNLALNGNRVRVPSSAPI